jgi:hypothetical protein
LGALAAHPMKKSNFEKEFDEQEKKKLETVIDYKYPPIA